ncbi:hypothetical protein LIER_18527 [Lithospermum erythrorhizon]|uniref:Reverse transcriptase/retrotransposon-derived protein RNase H-like domain-containing protein n=1 Tax=Lithospermum erythrorhizon TaxID=34254 RepID=A0AAV3QGN9_LITER
MLVKSKRSAKHLVNLEETLQRDRNLPFFRKLRQASKDEFVWDDGCEKAFEELKDYLRSPKILTRPEGKEELQLYLAVTEGAMSSVLMREEAKVQKQIYYLKAYFEAHPIVVVTEQPMKRILTNPAQTRRLTKWAIELSEFEITFVPRTGIKAQALANFIVECTARDSQEDPDYIPEVPERPQWVLHVDRARNPKGSGAGSLIQELRGCLSNMP